MTGELKWKYNSAADGPRTEFHTEAVVTEEVAVIGGDLREPGAMAHVYAFHPANGSIKWKYDLKNGIAGTILSDGTRVYAMTFQQTLIGLDIASGKLVTPLEEPLPNDQFLFPPSPVMSQDRIFYAKRNGVVRAVRKDNYKEIWSHHFSEQITSDLVTQGNSVFLATDARKIYQMDQNSGKIIRSFATDGIARWKPLSIGTNLLFLEWDDNNIPILKCMDVATGKEIWRQPSPEGTEWDTFRPLLWRDLVIVGSSAGDVVAFDASSGARAWSTKVQGGVRMLGASETFLYAGCRNGSLFALLPPS